MSNVSKIVVRETADEEIVKALMQAVKENWVRKEIQS